MSFIQKYQFELFRMGTTLPINPLFATAHKPGFNVEITIWENEADIFSMDELYITKERNHYFKDANVVWDMFSSNLTPS